MGMQGSDLSPGIQAINEAIRATLTVGTVTLNTTESTVANSILNPVNVSLTSTAVTVTGAVSLSPTTVTVAGTVSLTSTLVTVTMSSTTTARTVTLANTGVTISIGRTLTASTGSLAATNGTISLTPTNRIKVYALSLSTTQVTNMMTCIFHSGSVANGLELHRAHINNLTPVTLSVTPPAFLFQSRSGTAVSLSNSTAALVNYSISYFDEA